ncbi:MAG: glycine/betaine ABC transporter substrate-binding protein [Chloroflexota bacterium]|nr:quaternary ammonium transporter [Ardenticatenaceae bacterium]GIK59041.1 MAG: glycine/betaine ABC transporter substrate-binding protein [Chloroflexota bacterium]
MKKLIWLMMVGLVTAVLTSCSGGGDKTITVASKDFTEQFILGEMYALLLEDAGYKVERKLNLGGTPVAQQALLDGSIDVYPEYTGTGLLTVLKMDVMSDPQAVFNAVKTAYQEQFDLVWLNPAPMNNTQALAMTKARAAELGITTFSDMVANADQLVLIGPPEFAEREDGIPGLKRVYGDFTFKNFLTVDPGLRYQALLNGEADVVVAFGTDGELAAYDLQSLVDDKGLYPPYQVAPVIRQAALDANPEVADILNKVAPLLTDATMQRLNNEVSGNGREPADVAREFLVQQGLIK